MSRLKELEQKRERVGAEHRRLTEEIDRLRRQVTYPDRVSELVNEINRNPLRRGRGQFDIEHYKRVAELHQLISQVHHQRVIHHMTEVLGRNRNTVGGWVKIAREQGLIT